jgi:hypothetical protein
MDASIYTGSGTADQRADPLAFIRVHLRVITKRYAMDKDKVLVPSRIMRSAVLR